jgi:Predicted membrane protein
MKSTIKIAVAFLLIALAIGVLNSASAQSSAVEEAQAATNTAYNAITNAYNAGADTNPLIEQLNQAINITQQAQLTSDPQQAATLAAQAQAIAENVTQQANEAANTAQNAIPVIPITAAAAALAVGVAIFLLAPKALYQVWFKLRRNFKVKIANAPKKNEATFLTAEQLCAIILAITVIIAFISVSGFLLPSTSGEQFSELGILGPNMQLGDYPSTVVASQTVSLYGYVGNQMGQPMYYTVLVKLGDNNTQINPADLAATQTYAQVLPNNGTWTFPVTLPLTHIGDNQRIIFELWAYNQTLNQNVYQQRWGQVWVNVTSPAS